MGIVGYLAASLTSIYQMPGNTLQSWQSKNIPWNINHPTPVENFCLNNYQISYLTIGIYFAKGFPGGASGKEPTWQCRTLKRCKFELRVGMIPWRRKWQPTPVLLPGESHEQRSLKGYSPQGHKGSDRTEATQHARTHTYFANTISLYLFG